MNSNNPDYQFIVPQLFQIQVAVQLDTFAVQFTPAI